jgi:hypothetical protein
MDNGKGLCLGYEKQEFVGKILELLKKQKQG